MQAARVHLRPIAPCKDLARLRSITGYRGTSVDTPTANLAVSESQHPVNETDSEIGQNRDIVMDSEGVSFGNGDSDAMRSYYVAVASDIC